MSNRRARPRKGIDARAPTVEGKGDFDDKARDPYDSDSAIDLRQDHVARLYEHCRLGSTQRVKSLLSQVIYPQLDAQDSNGATPLCIASSPGHEDIVRLLLERGATVDTADADGDTPLVHAARHGRLAVAKALLDHYVSPDAVNARGETAVVAAASSGHFDVAQLLLSVGASVGGRASNGETLLLAAARWRDTNTLLLLTDRVRVKGYGCIHAVLSASLQTLREYGSSTHEFVDLWDGTVDHLLDLFKDSQDPDLPVSVVFEGVMIVGSLIRVKPTCESSSLLRRLAACRAVVNSVQDVHLEIDQLHRKTLGGSVDPVETCSWRLALERAEAVVLDVFDRELRDGVQLKDRLANEDVQTETISVLQYEISLHGDKCSPKLLELLKFALDRVLRLTSTEAVSLPPWFLSTGEVDFSQPEAEVDEETGRRTSFEENG